MHGLHKRPRCGRRTHRFFLTLRRSGTPNYISLWPLDLTLFLLRLINVSPWRQRKSWPYSSRGNIVFCWLGLFWSFKWLPGEGGAKGPCKDHNSCPLPSLSEKSKAQHIYSPLALPWNMIYFYYIKHIHE
jgi:hypothetical protein